MNDAVIRLMLVDDHAILRSGLAQLLDSLDGYTVVAQAGNGEEALALVEQALPDVILLDLQMPGLDGVETTRRLIASQSPARVLVLTSFSDRERIVGALDAGAWGYLLKDSDPDDLLAGIRAVARGESPLDPKVARELLTARQDAAPTNVTLTPREEEVLHLVRQGLANKQIARRLGISERTVKSHMTSVFFRIGVSDRTQAALWAERRGL